MSEASKQLAPAASSPAPSPTIAEPTTPKAVPKPKQKRIPRKIVELTELLLSGSAKNIADGARQIGCSREYLSRTLSARPDAVAYMQQRAARVLGVASTVAAAKMAALIHAESEHVAFRASDRVLGYSGIQPPPGPQIAVNVSVQSGFRIDLRERAEGPLPEIEKGVAGDVIIDAKPAE